MAELVLPSPQSALTCGKDGSPETSLKLGWEVNGE